MAAWVLAGQSGDFAKNTGSLVERVGCHSLVMWLNILLVKTPLSSHTGLSN